MKSTVFLSTFLILLCSANVILAQEKPAHADSIMHLAYQKAAKDNKKVLLIFHASWCGWCKKMDKALQDETCKTFFDENFITVHLTVQETGTQKKMENEGGITLKDSYNGKDKGLPYWVVLDNKGVMLGNALLPNGDNIGCPASKEEVEVFVALLKKNTALTAKELAIITKRFRENESR